MNRRAVIFVALIVYALLPMNLLATDQRTIDMRLKQLKMMSKVERDRLDRNIVAFQALREDQKSQYRKLHDDLVKDRNDAGNLSTLMETYSLWLQTLTPTQRDELQQEGDSAKKLAMIRRFKEEQDHPVETHDPHHEESLSHPVRKLPSKFALEKKDLDAAMKVLVEALPIERRKDEYNDPSLSVYLAIFNQSIQAAGSENDWPGDTLLVKIMASVRESTAKEIKKASSKRDQFIRMSLLGILKQANELVQEPTDDDRGRTWEAMTQEEREGIVNLPRPQMDFAIRRKFFESKGEDVLKLLKQRQSYVRQVRDMFDRLGVEPPPRLKQTPRGKG